MLEEQATEDQVMKTILMSAAFAVFVLGTAFGRVVIMTPTVQLHAAKVLTEHRAAQLGCRA
jgi:hypothetical protein